MSGSGDDSVRVTIGADSSGFTDGTKSAADAADALSASLNKLAQNFVTDRIERQRIAFAELGNSLKDLNPVWLDTGQGAMRLSEQTAASGVAARNAAGMTALMSRAARQLGDDVALAANAIQSGAVTYQSFAVAVSGLEGAFKSAEDSAQVFIKALNPTPLQSLRSLMGDAIPAAFRLTQSATRAVISTLFNLEGEFKSAADSAAVFNAAINPTPLQAFRAAMSSAGAANRVMQASTLDVINSTTGVDRGFKSAAESADVFSREIARIPLSVLRDTLSSLPPSLAQTQASLVATIEAATGVGREFKSAADSATVFNAALNPTPLAQLRALMAQSAAPAATLAVNFQAIINASTGVDRGFKSAADSAAIFNRALDPSPLQTLRDLMASDIPSAAAATAVNFQAVIDAATGVGRAFKSAEDSAAVFRRALDPTPLQTLRDLMGTAIPEAAQQTTLNLQAIIDTTTGVDRSFKSAADSADVFTREINRISLASLRTQLRAVESEGAATYRTLAENIDAANGIGVAFKSAAESAAVFNQALDPSPLQRMRKLMDETVPPADHASHSVAGITREFIVLGREGMVGDWTRIPGTLLALAERSGGLTTALGELIASFSAMQLAGVGAVLAVAAAFTVMIMRAHEANVAVREAMNAATLQGRDPTEAKAQMEAYGASMRDVGVVGSVAMAQITSAISQLSEVTDAQKQKIADQGTALFLNWGKDAQKTSEQISQIFASTSSLESYLQKEHLLSTTQQAAWAAATTAAQKYDIGIGAIGDRLGKINAQAKQMQEDARANMLAMLEAGADALPGSLPPTPQLQGKGNVTGPQDLGDFQPGTKQADPQQSADTAVVIELNKHNQELLDLKAKLGAAQRAETAAIAANDPVAAKNAQDAIAAAQTQIDMWKQLGDASWAGKQNAALSEILAKLASTATSSKQLAEDENKARIKFWDDAAQQAGLTEVQITEAHANANRARLTLAQEEVRGGEVAAKQTLEIRLAALNEEQAANRDNYAKVMAIEQQKIDLLRASGASAAKLLEEELSKEDALRHQHAALQGEIAAEALARERTADEAEFNQHKAALDEQVTEGKLSKARELANLEAFYDQQKAMELAALQALLATLPQESKAYQTTLDQMSTLKAQWLAKDQQMNAQILADHKATWDKMTAPIQSAMEAQINPVLRGTETIRQAELKMAQSIVLAYIDMAAKAALAWASGQAMQILWTGTGEAAKTSITAAGAASRTGINQTEAAAANTGLVARLARWIAMELGLTSATEAQSAVRTATSAAADTETEATAQATNVAQGMSYAATGAAAAGASVAAIPVTGWAMAPGVAAETYATLSGFANMASFAVGAWNLPRDMPANLHAGEMVVPASFAEGMRGAMGKGSGGGTTQTLNYAPNVRGGAGSDVNSLMRAQSAAFKSYLWHATRNGALSLPSGH